MKKSKLISVLADDFADWGRVAIRRIRNGTKRYGVLASPLRYSDEERG